MTSSHPTDAAPDAQSVPGESLFELPVGQVSVGKVRLQALYDLIKLLSGGRREAVPEALEKAIRTLEADRGFVGMRPPGGGLAVTAQAGMDATRSDAVSRSLIAHAADQGRSFIFPDPANPSAPAGSFSRKAVTLIAAPVTAQGKPIGLLYLDRLQGRPFTRDDLLFAVTLARGIGLSEEKRRLMEAELRTGEIRVQLELARELQKGLFPAVPPEFAGYRLSSYNNPCIDVSGDTYDVIDVGKGRLAVSIADVSGKGIDAAMLAGSVQASFRTAVRMRRDQDPFDLAGCVQVVNDNIGDGGENVRFVTFFAAVLDTRAAEFVYVNAGHNHPMMVHSDGRVAPLAGAQHIVLGLPEMRGYRQETCSFPPGGSLVLYTDGVSEAMNPVREQYGEERLTEALSRAAGRPAADMLIAVRRSLAAFVGETTSPSDDITLLAISAPPPA